MSEPRRVRRLHLRGPDAARVRRVLPRVEDALRVASIPLGPPGSLILIRRLDLGCIEDTASAQTLALRITELARRLAGAAVHVRRPGAAGAEVVWAASPAEVEALYVERLLRGPPPEEWFWRAARGEDRPQDLPGCLEALVDEAPAWPPALGGAPPARVEVLRRLTERGLLPELAARLPVGRLPEVQAPPTPEDPPALPPPWASALRAVVARLGPGWAGLPWLLTRALVAARPELDGHPALPRMAGAWRQRLTLEALAVAPTPRVGSPAAASSPGPASPGAPSVPAAAAPRRATPEAPGPALAPASTDAPRGVEAPAPRPAAPGSLPPEARPPAPEALPEPSPAPPAAAVTPPDPAAPEAAPWRLTSTLGGGLVVAVNLLERLGLGEHVRARPEAALQATGWRVVEALLDRAGLHPEDPLREALAPRVPPEEAPEAEVLAWAQAAEALCVERVELELAEVLRQPAWLRADALHVELLRPMDTVRLSLRREALDLDPGWVPWLGRVLRLRYLDEDELRALALITDISTLADPPG